MTKSAHILKTKVTQGDWLLRHLAGTELPADLGTRRLMGMYLGEEKEIPESQDRGEKKRERFQFEVRKNQTGPQGHHLVCTHGESERRRK